MKWQLTGALAVVLAACGGGEQRLEETGQAGGTAVDTVVTQRTVEDTAVVTHDTTVDVDTSMTRGDQGVGPADTVTDTRSTGTDTAATGQTGGQATPDTMSTGADTSNP